MTLDRWLPADRQRKLKPAEPPTIAQMRARLKRARLLTENAQNETSRKMANRLIAAWQPDDLVTLALQDLNSSSALLRGEALKFLQVVAPDKLPTT